MLLVCFCSRLIKKCLIHTSLHTLIWDCYPFNIQSLIFKVRINPYFPFHFSIFINLTKKSNQSEGTDAGLLGRIICFVQDPLDQQGQKGLKICLNTNLTGCTLLTLTSSHWAKPWKHQTKAFRKHIMFISYYAYHYSNLSL